MKKIMEWIKRQIIDIISAIRGGYYEEQEKNETHPADRYGTNRKTK